MIHEINLVPIIHCDGDILFLVQSQMLLARVYLVNNSSNHIFGFLCVSQFFKMIELLVELCGVFVGMQWVFFLFLFFPRNSFLKTTSVYVTT